MGLGHLAVGLRRLFYQIAHGLQLATQPVGPFPEGPSKRGLIPGRPARQDPIEVFDLPAQLQDALGERPARFVIAAHEPLPFEATNNAAVLCRS
jgi:hypothetical protein